MSTNWRSVEIAAKNLSSKLESSLERRSEERAQALVDSFNRTRGFWVLLHIPGFIFLWGGVTTIFMQAIKVNMFLSFAIGLAAAIGWWKSDFSKEHGFLAFLVTLVPLFLPIFVPAFRY